MLRYRKRRDWIGNGSGTFTQMEASKLKFIRVELDLHKNVITLSYFTEILSFIYHWVPF